MTTLLYVFTLVNSTSDSVVVVVVVKKGRQGMKVAKKDNGKDVPLLKYHYSACMHQGSGGARLGWPLKAAAPGGRAAGTARS